VQHRRLRPPSLVTGRAGLGHEAGAQHGAGQGRPSWFRRDGRGPPSGYRTLSACRTPPSGYRLVEPFAISQPAISRHLRVLAQAGLIL